MGNYNILKTYTATLILYCKLQTFFTLGSLNENIVFCTFSHCETLSLTALSAAFKPKMLSNVQQRESRLFLNSGSSLFAIVNRYAENYPKLKLKIVPSLAIEQLLWKYFHDKFFPP